MKPATLPILLPVLASLAASVKVGVRALALAPVSARQTPLSFAAPAPASPRSRHACRAAFSARTADDVGVGEWTSLTDDGGVKIRTLSPASAGASSEELPFPDTGQDVTVEYVGRIAPREWSVDDVNACWLPEQGLTPLAPKLFEAFDIDGAKLTNAKKMSKKFIFEGLGVLKEAKIDSLFRASQDLSKSDRTHPAGTVFDENAFTFRVGKGMTIRAFDLAIREMREGQTMSVMGRCDYAYGKHGLRDAGKCLVPPYATVLYDLTLVEIKQ